MKILAGRYEIHEKIGEGGMAVVYTPLRKPGLQMLCNYFLR